MRPFASPPPVSQRERIFERLGLAALPVALGLVWKASTITIGRGAPPTEGLRAFFVAMAVMLVAVCVWPRWGRFRTERFFRRHGALLARCPSCGAAGEGSSGCARCAFVAKEGEGWQLVAVDPLGVVVMASAAAAMFGLAGMFFLGLADAQTDLSRFLLLALGALVASLAFALLAGAVGLTRGVLSSPPRFTWSRTWYEADATHVLDAEVTVAASGPVARGTTHRTSAPPPDVAPPEGDATPFERGLARVFFRWDRDGIAPLLRDLEQTWRWPSPRVDGAGEVYRSAAATPDEVVREERVAWSVNFNDCSFARALEELSLPAPEQVEGEEAEELAEADWSVPSAVVAQVMGADARLRVAVEAGADEVAPSAPGYGAALRAARAT